MATSDRTVTKPVVNVLTKAQYQSISSPSADEFYLITDDSAITAGTGISTSVAGGETLVSLDSSYGLTASDISTGTSTTNKLVSAKVLADAIAEGGGGSYTATSPISISSGNDISHNTSGVTAGTYVAYYDSKTPSYYLPTITVDSSGHITSASNTGVQIPTANSSGQSGIGLMTYAADYCLRNNLDYAFPHIYGDSYGYPFSIAAGSSSKTVSMSITKDMILSASYYNQGNKFIGSTYISSLYVIGVESFLYNGTNYEPVLVNWTATDATYNSSTLTYSCTVTVSTAEAIATGNTLYFKILYAPRWSTM